MEEVKKNRPFKEITINGKVFKALLDTGADVSSTAGKKLIYKLAHYIYSLHTLWCNACLRCCSRYSHFYIRRSRKIEELSILLWYPLCLSHLEEELLNQIGTFLLTPSGLVLQQLIKMSFDPHSGFGKRQEICLYPLTHNKEKIEKDLRPGNQSATRHICLFSSCSRELSGAEYRLPAWTHGLTSSHLFRCSQTPLFFRTPLQDKLSPWQNIHRNIYQAVAFITDCIWK